MLAGQAHFRAVPGKHIHELLVLRRLLCLRRVLRKKGIQRARRVNRRFNACRLPPCCRLYGFDRRFLVRQCPGLRRFRLRRARLRFARHRHQHGVQRRRGLFRFRLCLDRLALCFVNRFGWFVLLPALREFPCRLRRLFGRFRSAAFVPVGALGFPGVLCRRLFRAARLVHIRFRYVLGLLCVRFGSCFRVLRRRNVLCLRAHVLVRVLRVVQRAAEVVFVRLHALRRRFGLHRGTKLRAHAFRRRSRLHHEILCFHLFTTFLLSVLYGNFFWEEITI